MRGWFSNNLSKKIGKFSSKACLNLFLMKNNENFLKNKANLICWETLVVLGVLNKK